ncbi:hypothetical protein NPIL_334641, partial [Nephila pilipes]
AAGVDEVSITKFEENLKRQSIQTMESGCHPKLSEPVKKAVAMKDTEEDKEFRCLFKRSTG